LPKKSEGTSRGLHSVAGVDVVLDQHRNAMQGATYLASGAQIIGLLRHRERVRIQLDDGIYSTVRAVLVEQEYSLEIELG
jgi:hypothetical protein